MEKNNVGEILGTILGLTMILLVLVLFVLIVTALFEKGFYTTAQNDFCMQKNHQKATGFHTVSGRYYQIYIECDHNTIYEVKERRPCIKQNKWGECTKQKTVYSDPSTKFYGN